MSVKTKPPINAKKTFPSGQYECGEWEFGRRKGKGILSKNRLYEGYSGNLKERGKKWWGRISQYDEADCYFTLLHTGEIEDSLPQGWGYQHKPDGSYYEGEFLKGKRSGSGRSWYRDGSFYEGEWLNNCHHGTGLLVLENGNRYEGEWSEGRKSGKGRYYHLDSGQLQCGLWKDGIAVTSTIQDLPYRVLAALRPTPIQIPKLELDLSTPCWAELRTLEYDNCVH